MRTRYTRKQLSEDVEAMNQRRSDLVPLGVNNYYEHTQVYAKVGPHGAIRRLQVGTPRECYTAACQYFAHPPRYAIAANQ